MQNLKKSTKLAVRILFYGIAVLILLPTIAEIIWPQSKEITNNQTQKEKSPEEYYQAGLKAINNQIYTDANKLFDLAVAGYVKRGDDYYFRNEFTKAKEAYSQALAISPNDVDINFDLVMAESGAKQYQEEAKTLDKIWQIQTMGIKMAPYYYYRSEVLFMGGKYNEALVQINNALVADGSHTEYYRLKIDILTKLGRLKEVEAVKKELADLEK
jgi:tetratricopeptide (TPR) repeat protein